MFTSTTPPHKWDEQLKSRTLFFEVILTAEQVTEIEHRIAHETLTPEERVFELKSFNLFLHTLKRQNPKDAECFYSVEVPFLSKLIKHHPEKTGQDVRRFKLLKALIQSSAILHQNHREVRINEKGRQILVASEADLNYVSNVVDRMLPLPNRVAGQRYLNTFRTIAFWLYSNPEKSKQEIRQSFKALSQRRLEDDLPDLEAAGLISGHYVFGSKAKAYRMGKKIFEVFAVKTPHDDGYFTPPKITEAEFWDKVRPVIKEIEDAHKWSPVPVA